VIGKALGVEEVILLKDVPGVLSGDPRVVDMPERLPSITVEECLDLAIKGGEVVCPLSLVYKPRDVNLRIVSYDSESLLEGGTVVLGEIEREVKIYVKEGMAVVTVVGKRMNEVLGLLAEFSSTLCKEGINIYSVLTSNFSIGFYVDQDQRERAVSLLHDMVLGNRELSSVVSLSDLSIITVIGKTFADQPGLLAKIAVALAEEKIDLIDVSTTMEEFNLFVHMSDAKRAKRVLERVLNVGK
jgi:aspartate kinase